MCCSWTTVFKETSNQWVMGWRRTWISMAKWGPPPGINTASAISLYINTDLKIQVCMRVINWHGCFIKSIGTRTLGSPSSFTEQPVHKWKILSKQLAGCNQSKKIIMHSVAKKPPTSSSQRSHTQRVCHFARRTPVKFCFFSFIVTGCFVLVCVEPVKTKQQTGK